MINGFTGLGLNELVGALSRSKYGQQSPPRNIQPMPKMDTVQFSVRGRELAASSEGAGPRQPMVAERPVGTEKPASPASEMSMIDRMKAAFFTRDGDERFDASVDLNADGRINYADLAVLREQGAPANPDNPKEMLQDMRSAFMTRSGDERFDARMDMNSDGVINFADLAMLRAKLESAVTRPPAEPLVPETPTAPEPVVAQDTAAANPRIDDQGATIESIRSAFFTSAGDASYTAAADLNGDGRINFADLAELRAE